MTFTDSTWSGPKPFFAKSTFFKMDSIVKKARQMLEHGFDEAGINLTADQWVVIERMRNASVMSQHQLAEECFKDAGTITRILDLLCKKGYAQRRPSSSDRRSYEVFLTEAGKQIFETAKEVSQKVRAKGFGSICPKEFDIFNNLLETIYFQMITN